jgi:hypothetical protein
MAGPFDFMRNINNNNNSDWQMPGTRDVANNPSRRYIQNTGAMDEFRALPDYNADTGIFKSPLADIGGGGVDLPDNGSWSDMFSGDSMFGGTDAQGNKSGGWVSPTLNLGLGAMDAWTSYKQLGLAEDTLDFQRDSFSKEFENQTSLTNTELSDRQAQRVAANPNAQSVDSYMAEHGI